MTWQNKILISLAALLVIVGFVAIIKYQHDTIEKQRNIETSLIEMKHLAEGITRAQSQYATPKDIENFAKEIGIKLDPIRDDLKNLGADVKTVQQIKVITQGYSATGLPSDTSVAKNPTEPTVTEDKFGYLKASQVLKLNEPTGTANVPFGEVKFNAWKERPWDLIVLPRTYSVTNVLAQDDDGKHYAYSKFGVDVEGKHYDLQVTQNKMLEEMPSSKFRFNPTLLFGIDAGVYWSTPQFELNPNLQLALFSYSQTKQLPQWLFLGLGMGYSTQIQEVSFIMSPVNYNIAEHIPLIKNLYIGPSVSLDTKGNFAILGGVRVSL